MPLIDVIHPKIKPTKHFHDRLKNRLRMKNPHSRRSFIKRASKGALAVREIPQDGFLDFLNYMARRERGIRKDNRNLRLFLYLDYFIIASYSGELITIYEVDQEWRGSYQNIMRAKTLEVQESETLW